MCGPLIGHVGKLILFEQFDLRKIFIHLYTKHSEANTISSGCT